MCARTLRLQRWHRVSLDVLSPTSWLCSELFFSLALMVTRVDSDDSLPMYTSQSFSNTVVSRKSYSCARHVMADWEYTLRIAPSRHERMNSHETCRIRRTLLIEYQRNKNAKTSVPSRIRAGVFTELCDHNVMI